MPLSVLSYDFCLWIINIRKTCSDIVRKMQYGIANGCEVTLLAADLKQIVHTVCNIQSNR